MIYTDKEKRIYTSPVGTTHDPVTASNLLILHSQGRWNDWLAAFYKPESEVERSAAALELAKVGRVTFDLKPLTAADGYGDGAVLEVVDHFMDYLSKKA